LLVTVPVMGAACAIVPVRSRASTRELREIRGFLI
jgi:hypothetical protein